MVWFGKSPAREFGGLRPPELLVVIAMVPIIAAVLHMQVSLIGEAAIAHIPLPSLRINEVKTLQGFLPICSICKKVRDDQGYWNQIESYIRDRSDAEFSHGICPDCMKTHYPDLDIDD